MGVLDSLKATVGLGGGDGASASGLPTHAAPAAPPAAASAAKSGGFLEGIKTRMGLNEPPPPPASLPSQLLQSATRALDEHTPHLTWQQRAIGFGICLGVGLLLSFLVGGGGLPGRRAGVGAGALQAGPARGARTAPARAAGLSH
jgi:hypothetical protein